MRQNSFRSPRRGSRRLACNWHQIFRAKVLRHTRWFGPRFLSRKQTLRAASETGSVYPSGLNGPSGRNASAVWPTWRADNPKPKYRRSCSLRLSIVQTINEAVPLERAGPGGTPRKPHRRRRHSSNKTDPVGHFIFVSCPHRRLIRIEIAGSGRHS